MHGGSVAYVSEVSPEPKQAIQGRRIGSVPGLSTQCHGEGGSSPSGFWKEPGVKMNTGVSGWTNQTCCHLSCCGPARYVKHWTRILALTGANVHISVCTFCVLGKYILTWTPRYSCRSECKSSGQELIHRLHQVSRIPLLVPEFQDLFSGSCETFNTD